MVKFSIYLNRRVFVMILLARKQALLSTKQSIDIFSYFYMKAYVVGTQWKHFSEALLMNTHNICFHGEIIKIFIRIPCLIRDMHAIGWGLPSWKQIFPDY